MTDEKTLSIKEVATAIGCSVQAVYQRLEKDFKPYFKEENGKKRLDIAVLEHVKQNENSTALTSDFKETLKLLETQINKKDLQITHLQTELSAEREHNREKDKELMAVLSSLAAGQAAAQQKQLADTLIEGKQLIASGADPVEPKIPQEKKRWKFWKK